jgi:hypothetical protein
MLMRSATMIRDPPRFRVSVRVRILLACRGGHLLSLLSMSPSLIA